MRLRWAAAPHQGLVYPQRLAWESGAQHPLSQRGVWEQRRMAMAYKPFDRSDKRLGKQPRKECGFQHECAPNRANPMLSAGSLTAHQNAPQAQSNSGLPSPYNLPLFEERCETGMNKF
jgi:hypothetical protein